MHELWSRRAAAQQVFADAPPPAFDASRPPYAEHLRALIERHADELAAVIVEPVVQGAGGMRFYSPGICGCCAGVRRATACCWSSTRSPPGSGARGSCSPAAHAAVTPDIMCLGKALTGGYPDPGRHAVHLAGGATASRRARSRCWPTGRRSWAIHWPPPWPCASIGLLLGQDWLAEVKRIEIGPARRARARRRAAGRARCAGARRDRRGAARSPRGHERRRREAAVREGVWLRPFRDLVYTMPPYVTRRRGRGAHRPRGVRGGEGGHDMPVLVITGHGHGGRQDGRDRGCGRDGPGGRPVGGRAEGRADGACGRRRPGDAEEVARLAGEVTVALKWRGSPSRWRRVRPRAGRAGPRASRGDRRGGGQARHRARPGAAGRGRGRAARTLRRGRRTLARTPPGLLGAPVARGDVGGAGHAEHAG